MASGGVAVRRELTCCYVKEMISFTQEARVVTRRVERERDEGREEAWKKGTDEKRKTERKKSKRRRRWRENEREVQTRRMRRT